MNMRLSVAAIRAKNRRQPHQRAHKQRYKSYRHGKNNNKQTMFIPKREEYMGLGPTEGGDKLMRPTAMTPASDPAPTTDNKPPASGDQSKKQITHKLAFRPLRIKGQQRAKDRKQMGDALAEKIKAAVKGRHRAPHEEVHHDEGGERPVLERVQRADKRE